ncbi:MAG: fumarylacetoacetate hydrolase family protein [Oscillochloridaceae bacterium umkhey_bin13]
MRLVTFVPPDGLPRAGALLGAALVDLAAAAPLALEDAEGLAWDMLSLLRADQDAVSLESAADILAALTQMLGGEPDLAGFPDDLDDPLYQSATEDLDGSLSIGGAALIYPLTQVRLLAPLPRPASLRLYDAFEEHAIAVATLRGNSLPGAWYRGPALAFGNHGAIYGPGAPILLPPGEMLDYGLSLACVIGRSGRDLDRDEAQTAIAGYCLANSWANHDHDELERLLGRGPGKSRDFATSLGPWLVTSDELEMYAGDDGRLSLSLIAEVNGLTQIRATAALQYYPFADLVADASRHTTLVPGDVIIAGPLAGGTLLEQTSGYGPWLAPGDIVELSGTGLGSLTNRLE